jgi:hypothetical protein
MKVLTSSRKPTADWFFCAWKCHRAWQTYTDRGFVKWGYPEIIHFRLGLLSIIKHPAMGVPLVMEPMTGGLVPSIWGYHPNVLVSKPMVTTWDPLWLVTPRFGSWPLEFAWFLSRKESDWPKPGKIRILAFELFPVIDSSPPVCDIFLRLSLT